MISLNQVSIGEQARHENERVVNRVRIIQQEHFSTRKAQSFVVSKTFPFSSGEPIPQNYRNTDITLSNVRINDEL